MSVFIFSLLGLTVLLILIALLLPKVDNALIYDPVLDNVLKWFAYVFMGFCVVGIVCIFWEAIRIPAGVALGVYFLVFLSTLVCFKGYEKILYMQHKHDYPKVQPCEITKHEYEVEKRVYTDENEYGRVVRKREVSKVTFNMHIKFTDSGQELEFSETKSLPFYDNVMLGDKALAKCVYVGQILFIVGLDRADYE